MSRNTTRPGLNRSFTKLAVALVAASIATTATAGMALAGKEPPRPVFEQTADCVPMPDGKGGNRVAAEVDLRFEGKGRWVNAQYKSEVVDSSGTTEGYVVTVRHDMKSSTPMLSVDSTDLPFVATFYARAVDRNGDPLEPGPEDGWKPSYEYKCQ